MIAKVHVHEHNYDCSLSSAMGIHVDLLNRDKMDFSKRDVCGVLLQYPDTEGSIYDLSHITEDAHANGVCLYYRRKRTAGHLSQKGL